MLSCMHLPPLPIHPKPGCHACISHLCTSTPNHAAMHASPTSAHPPQTMLPCMHLPPLPIHPKPGCHGCISHLCPSTPNQAAMHASPTSAHPPQTRLQCMHLPPLPIHPKPGCHSWLGVDALLQVCRLISNATAICRINRSAPRNLLQSHICTQYMTTYRCAS